MIMTILSTFEQLLKRDGSVTIHIRNIQLLAIEVYKVVNRISPEAMDEIFQLKECPKYSTRSPFNSYIVKTVAYGTETLSFLGPKIWSLVPKSLKESTSLIEI